MPRHFILAVGPDAAVPWAWAAHFMSRDSGRCILTLVHVVKAGLCGSSSLGRLGESMVDADAPWLLPEMRGLMRENPLVRAVEVWAWGGTTVAKALLAWLGDLPRPAPTLLVMGQCRPWYAWSISRFVAKHAHICPVVVVRDAGCGSGQKASGVRSGVCAVPPPAANEARNVVIAVDGRWPGSGELVQWSRDFLLSVGDHVSLLNILPHTFSHNDKHHAEMERCQLILRNWMVFKGGGSATTVELPSQKSSPGRAICAFLKAGCGRGPAHLLIMGSRTGHILPWRSTSGYVLKHARCPVLSVDDTKLQMLLENALYMPAVEF